MQQEELHEKCTVCKRHMQALWIIHWFQLPYLNCITKSRLMHTHKYACMRANKYALLYLPYALPASMCIKIYQPRQRHMHKKSCVLVSSRSPTFEGTYVPTRVHPRKQPHTLVSCQSLQHCQGIFPPGSSGSSDRTNSGAANFHSPLRFFSQALTCRKHWKQKNGAQISKGFSLQWKKINKGNGLLWHTAGEVCLTSKLLAIPQRSPWREEGAGQGRAWRPGAAQRAGKGGPGAAGRRRGEPSGRLKELSEGGGVWPRKGAEAGPEGTASGSRSGRPRGDRGGGGGAALPVAVQVVLRRLGLPRASQPPQGAQDAPQLGLEAVHHRVAPRHGPEESGVRGLRPGGLRHARHGTARPGPGASLSPGNGRGQRPRGAALGKAGGTAGGGFSTASVARHGM